MFYPAVFQTGVSTHSRPKAAALFGAKMENIELVSTHSHPKVAASCHRMNPLSYVFQHTATRRWLRVPGAFSNCSELFQHTATRRWLPRKSCVILNTSSVSTHSHPKVAAFIILSIYNRIIVSTHSHPKVAAF